MVPGREAASGGAFWMSSRRGRGHRLQPLQLCLGCTGAPPTAGGQKTAASCLHGRTTNTQCATAANSVCRAAAIAPCDCCNAVAARHSPARWDL